MEYSLSVSFHVSGRDESEDSKALSLSEIYDLYHQRKLKKAQKNSRHTQTYTDSRTIYTSVKLTLED